MKKTSSLLQKSVLEIFLFFLSKVAKPNFLFGQILLSPKNRLDVCLLFFKNIFHWFTSSPQQPFTTGLLNKV